MNKNTNDFLFQIVRSDEGCRSYLLAPSFNPSARFSENSQEQIGTVPKALVVDPSLAALDVYLEWLEKARIRNVWILDTHTHADHFSASSTLAEKISSKFSVEILMSERTNSSRPTRKLRHGEKFTLGENLEAEVFITPGHTPDSLALQVSTPAGSLVFSGDSLLIGSCGRTDFPKASPDDLQMSLQNVFSKFEDDTWVFPAHDYSGLLFSNIGTEKKLNNQFRMALDSAEEGRLQFQEEKNREVLAATPVVERIVQFNLEKLPKAPGIVPAAASCAKSSGPQAIRTVDVESLKALLKEPSSGVLFIDVRESEEYEEASISGLENDPLSTIWREFKKIQKAKTVHFSCRSGARSGMVASSFARMGLNNVVNVAGGISGWMAKGYPVVEHRKA